MVSINSPLHSILSCGDTLRTKTRRVDREVFLVEWSDSAAEELGWVGNPLWQVQRTRRIREFWPVQRSRAGVRPVPSGHARAGEGTTQPAPSRNDEPEHALSLSDGGQLNRQLAAQTIFYPAKLSDLLSRVKSRLDKKQPDSAGRKPFRHDYSGDAVRYPRITEVARGYDAVNGRVTTGRSTRPVRCEGAHPRAHGRGVVESGRDERTASHVLQDAPEPDVAWQIADDDAA
ncbi:unnamed protein product [Parascedosporium putredinis]|uniref:Uncharacterized protein n=1 Tax=Parascedosporium putredinis TaxID=1442378 RepID=A0A9P1H3Q2_9PEZI|nr:unnamed protein product [Parascedosporium putredinis]CAI7997454.1 unnamed protein product [Parascedosporium putredinis]